MIAAPLYPDFIPFYTQYYIPLNPQFPWLKSQTNPSPYALEHPPETVVDVGDWRISQYIPILQYIRGMCVSHYNYPAMIIPLCAIMCHLNPIKSPLKPYVQCLNQHVQWWKSWFSMVKSPII